MSRFVWRERKTSGALMALKQVVLYCFSFYPNVPIDRAWSRTSTGKLFQILDPGII